MLGSREPPPYRLNDVENRHCTTRRISLVGDRKSHTGLVGDHAWPLGNINGHATKPRSQLAQLPSAE